jgi:predicted aspartyl protease
VNKKIVMKARVNNSAVELVLDTGSERTTLSEATAARAGVRALGSTLAAGVGFPGVTRLSVGSVDRIDIAGMRIRQVPVSIRPVPRMGGLPAWQNEIFSPMALGLSTVIDYQRRRVTFSRHLDDTAADVRLPLRVYRLPLVRGVLNTRVPAYFVVDTGGELISISADTATELHMTPPRHIPLRVIGMSGVDEGAFLLPGVDVAFQDIEYRNFGLAVLNLRAPSALLGFQVGGIVGHRFLAGYRVSMDLERSELRLSKSGGGS